MQNSEVKRPFLYDASSKCPFGAKFLHTKSHAPR